MAGDIGVLHKIEVAHAVERAWKESFIMLPEGPTVMVLVIHLKI